MIEDWIRVDKSQEIIVVVILCEVLLSFIYLPPIQALYPQYNAYVVYQWFIAGQIGAVASPTVFIFFMNMLLWLEHFLVASWNDYRYRKKKEAESKEAGKESDTVDPSQTTLPVEEPSIVETSTEPATAGDLFG